ncbi:Tn3 family transposase [Streptomyces sp. MMS24-I29]|uniref:Tn3 family transposase n=1 Tax=Streptomyces sp. MMS24-I29 TaxID=3351480 RepID=UPI003C7E823B
MSWVSQRASAANEGWEIDPEDLAHISPYLTEHINRFGEYSHPRTRHPARRVRAEARRRLHPAARAGPDRCRPRPGRLTRECLGPLCR